MSGLYTRIRLILADDHEIFRDGFRVMLRKYSEIELVNEAADGRELIRQVREHTPDVVITDIKMPVMDGVEATKILKREFPDLPIIALSMFDEENLIVDMLESGAKGYLLKNAPKEEIITAVNTVYKGQPYFSMHTSNKLAQIIAKSSFHPYKKAVRPDFSDKEIEIIKMICKEMSNKEIAAELNLSVRTVEGYREKIQEKMNVRNIAGIVIYAIKNDIYKC